MPLVQVTMIEGRTPEQVEALHRELTDAVVRALGAKPEAIRTIVYEVPASRWAVGGEPKG
jgi:4-oxalocrotonate tautomerase